eukprot:12925-Heterococcus_DN1.PRE.3
MHEAAQHFVGEHDFRNVAKMDCANVTCFKRNVNSAAVLTVRACALWLHYAKAAATTRGLLVLPDDTVVDVNTLQ